MQNTQRLKPFELSIKFEFKYIYIVPNCLQKTVLRMDTDIRITLPIYNTGGSSMYSEWVSSSPQSNCSHFGGNVPGSHDFCLEDITHRSLLSLVTGSQRRI